MQTSNRNDDRDEGGAGGGNDPKLIPDWDLPADGQVIVAGLAVVAILALLVGWTAWRGGDDDAGRASASVLDEAPSDGGSAADDAESSGEAGAADTETGDQAVATTIGPTTTAEPQTSTTSTAATAATEPAGPVIGDVQAAVDQLPGAITATGVGTVATLEGFVANAAERREAEAAATAVAGVSEVESNLVLLEPAVQSALIDAGVSGATAVGRGTEISVSGTIDAEAERAPVLASAASVEGVSEIIDDRLVVSVTAEVNQLPQVQFATNSAQILAVSFGDLDTAAELIDDAGDVRIEIQGYTDTVGDAAANQRLSERRALAVRTYLVAAGVDANVLTATGFGETDRFGQDLASNRLVRFQQIDG